MIKNLFTNSEIVIIVKDLKNSRDSKNWEMLKTVNTLVKKGIQSTMIFKKARTFY